MPSATASRFKAKAEEAQNPNPVAVAVTKALTSPPKRLVQIGPTTDKMFDLREKKRLLEAEIKKLDDEYLELEAAMFEKMDAEGTTKGAGSKATVSISSAVVADVQDWDSFFAFIAKKKYWHLVQRRASDPGVRELFEKGVVVPGVSPFTKRRLNLRVASGI